MSVHCAVCINLYKEGDPKPAPLGDDDIHLIVRDDWTYVACNEHAELLETYGPHRALKILRGRTTPAERAT